MILEVQNISKSFGRLSVLNNLNLEVKEGELKAIIGPNGAGKTTLFNVISGRLFPDDGSIFFLGKDITKMKPHMRSQMGLARSFQINNFFSKLTILENIQLAVQSRLRKCTSIWRNTSNENHTEDETFKILQLINLEKQAGVIASNLSYGDQRKLEIGLALGTNPSLVLLDEPTCGMSRFESGAMIDLIEKLSRHVTIVLIEHDIEFVMKVSDSILVMHYGQKIAEGKPVDIEQNEDVQRIYLGGF